MGEAMRDATGDAMGEAATRLKLRAEDAEDLKVVAATLRGAVAKVGDMAYRPRERRFVIMVNRFRWETAAPPAGRLSGPVVGGERTRAGLRFDYVDKVQSVGFRPGVTDQVLELLTIDSAAGANDAAEIVLIFAGGAKLRLAAECVDCTLDDIGRPWPTPRRPDHAIDDSD